MSGGYSLLFDETGASLGVHIKPDLWEQVSGEVLPLLQQVTGTTPEEETFPEPLQDWLDLEQYWDMPYPLSYDVHCSHCDSSTENWQEDSPRKFHLKAASFGGLVAFECQKCQSRVTKRFFKDGPKSETTPLSE